MRLSFKQARSFCCGSTGQMSPPESSELASSALFTFEASNHFLVVEQLSAVGLFESFEKESILFHGAQSGVFHQLRHPCAVIATAALPALG